MVELVFKPTPTHMSTTFGVFFPLFYFLTFYYGKIKHLDREDNTMNLPVSITKIERFARFASFFVLKYFKVNYRH